MIVLAAEADFKEHEVDFVYEALQRIYPGHESSDEEKVDTDDNTLAGLVSFSLHNDPERWGQFQPKGEISLVVTPLLWTDIPQMLLRTRIGSFGVRAEISQRRQSTISRNRSKSQRKGLPQLHFAIVRQWHMSEDRFADLRADYSRGTWKSQRYVCILLIGNTVTAMTL